MKKAAARLVAQLDLAGHPEIQIGVVESSDTGTALSPLTNDRGRVVTAINAITLPGVTAAAGGLREGLRVMRQGRGQRQAGDAEVMLLVSDSMTDADCAKASGAANQVKADGITLATVAADDNGGSDDSCMSGLASARYAYEARFRDLSNAFERVRNDLLVDKRSTTVDLTHVLPPELRYLPDSAQPPPRRIGPDGATVSWQLRAVPADGVTVTLRVQPLTPGSLPAAARVDSLFTDYQNKVGAVDFEIPWLTVLRPVALVPPPTATATVPPPPTWTPTPAPSASPQPTWTPTAVPSASPTRAPRPAYLPALTLWRCAPIERPVDVVLLIDASTSMTNLTSAGRPKLAAAQAAVAAFIDLQRPIDRTALVAFHHDAIRLADLSADRPALLAALAGVQPAEGTRLDLALGAAADLVAGAGHRPEARAAVILLTDGRPTGTTDAEVRAAAARARAGASLFALGVGADVDPLLLAEVAGQSSRYYPVEDAEALREILGHIRETIPCYGAGEGGPFNR